MLARYYELQAKQRGVDAAVVEDLASGISAGAVPDVNAGQLFAP
jgi:hypothetical protein